MEVLAHDQWRVHPDVAASVDALLAGRQPRTQLRTHRHGKLLVRFEMASADEPVSNPRDVNAEETWLETLGKLAKTLNISDATA